MVGLQVFPMAPNLPRSSAMSPIPLFRKVTAVSVSKGRSSLHKKLVQLFNQKTLVGSLISKRDQERMKKGKALLHVVGSKPVQCIPLEAPGQIAGGGGGNGYKGGRPPSSGISIPASQRTQTPLSSPNMSSVARESIISGQGPALPPSTKGAVASTPRFSRKQETRICGVVFGGEIKEARSIISSNGAIEEIFLNLLEECEDAEKVLDVHDSLETGHLEEAVQDSPLWMPFVAQYVKLLRSTMSHVSSSLTKEQQGTKIRLLARPEGKFMKGLAEAEVLAENHHNLGGGADVAILSSTVGEKEMAEEEGKSGSDVGGRESHSEVHPTVGEKRANNGPSSQCPKILRRSLSNASLASESSSSLSTTEEFVQEVPALPEVNTISTPAPHPIKAGEKEEGEVFENARKSMLAYGRRISQSAVRSEDLDSDEEEKTDRGSGRFVDYPEGVGRAMAIGPIIPKTQEFIVVGPVPMGDSMAVALNKKMTNLAKAVSEGDKGSKALTAFSPHEIQKNFSPGESFLVFWCSLSWWFFRFFNLLIFHQVLWLSHALSDTRTRSRRKCPTRLTPARRSSSSSSTRPATTSSGFLSQFLLRAQG